MIHRDFKRHETPFRGIPTPFPLSPQIESETSNSEKDLDDAMERLATLGREVSALKTKRANNSMAAARAEETATMARDKANEAKQVCVRMCVYVFPT